jgi:hypothetical protein
MADPGQKLETLYGGEKQTKPKLKQKGLGVLLKW